MRPPSWFKEELKWTAPELRLFYFERYRKWMIVSQSDKRIPGITDYEPISGKNFVVEMVIEDDRNNPVELDRRALFAVKLALKDPYRRKPFSFYFRMLTEAERKRQRDAAKERAQRFKDAGQDMHHMMTARTFS